MREAEFDEIIECNFAYFCTHQGRPCLVAYSSEYIYADIVEAVGERPPGCKHFVVRGAMSEYRVPGDTKTYE